jgi:hypothetical protein
MNKRLRYNLIIVLLAILMLALLCACEQPPTEVTAKYVAAEGGHIFGITKQTVPYGEDAKRVIAYADTGYVFLGWSDGVAETERLDTNLHSDITVTAEFAEILHNVTYNASENGRIQGEAIQTVRHSTSTTKVTAIANDNYMFVKWSDGIRTAERSDLYVRSDIEVTAIFEKLQKTFVYQYNNETDFYSKENNTVENANVHIDTLTETQFVVPIREHFTFDGWYFEKTLNTRVSDEKGQLLVGEEVFDNSSKTLYAKWNNISEPPVYKILMVYVTEVHATLMSNKNPERIDVPIQVDYVMSDTERKICEMLSEQFSKYLNETFNGLVVFEVDSHFTTEPITTDHFLVNGQYPVSREYSLFAYQISEVNSLRFDYRSVMTVFCLNDYETLLRSDGGSAMMKYGCVRMESFLGNHILNKIPLENILDTNYVLWGKDYWHTEGITTTVHEFIHTCEQWLPRRSYEWMVQTNLYHSSSVYLKNYYKSPTYNINGEYLLNNIVIEGDRVGIPYEYWRDDIYPDPLPYV